MPQFFTVFSQQTCRAIYNVLFRGANLEENMILRKTHTHTYLDVFLTVHHELTIYEIPT